MKSADRAPSGAELGRMKELVEKGMKEGAWGVSTGLFYAPGSFAKVDEIVELAKVVRPFGGIYASHIRDESDYTIGLKASIAEAIEVGEKAGVPVEISHIKALGKPVWGQAAAICGMIEAARARGVKVTADQYPYAASGTSMSAAALPRWVEADGKTRERLTDAQQLPRIREEIAANIERRGGPETLLISSCRARPEWEGKTLLDVSRQLGKTPVEAAIDVVLLGGAGVTSFNMSEEDIEYFMKRPYVMTASDGDVVEFGRGLPHPRSYGTFVRKIRLYALEKKVITLEQAIRASSGLPAETLGLKKRGFLKQGLAADLVVFDPKSVADQATYTRPHQYAAGILCVLVNGKVEVEKGTFTGALGGRPLTPASER
jgi:N-acyl-D-amino-acid deacylase